MPPQRFLDNGRGPEEVSWNSLGFCDREEELYQQLEVLKDNHDMEYKNMNQFHPISCCFMDFPIFHLLQDDEKRFRCGPNLNSAAPVHFGFVGHSSCPSIWRVALLEIACF